MDLAGAGARAVGWQTHFKHSGDLKDWDSPGVNQKLVDLEKDGTVRENVLASLVLCGVSSSSEEK